MKKMKISIRLFIITIGMLLLLQVPVLAATGKSTATNVRVRKTASTESEVIELLGIDDVVEILGQEGDWYKVNFKGTIGYVSQSFISTNEKIEDNKQEENKTEENNTQNVDNTQNANNVEEPKKEENTDNNSANENVPQNTDTTPVTTNNVYKIAESTKVYILPVVTSEFVGEVKKDNEVSLIINAGFWVYIQNQDVSGWVRIDKLSTENVNVDTSANETTNNETQQAENNDKTEQNENTESNKNEENKAEEQQSNYTPKTMYVKSSAINVRSQSNTSSDVVDSLAINAEVKVVGEENGWYKVEVSGKSGYIRQDLLSNEKTEVTSRNNELDRTAAAQAQQQAQQTAAQTQQATQTPATTQAEQTTQAQQPAQTTSSVPVSSSGVTGTDIANYAKQFVGCKYVYGHAGPSSFDCSGLTMYVYKHFGYNLSHSSRTQATQGKAVTGDLQPGDILVFSNNGKTVGHVGIYLGNDKFVHASDSSTGVIISNLSDRWNKSKYWGARRIL